MPANAEPPSAIVQKAQDAGAGDLSTALQRIPSGSGWDSIGLLRWKLSRCVRRFAAMRPRTGATQRKAGCVPLQGNWRSPILHREV